MKNVTLTDHDIRRFADTARHSLALYGGQFALIQPKFPTVTDAAVVAMIAQIEADPHGTQKHPGIDTAVFFAACYMMGAIKLKAEIEVLSLHPDPVAVLHSIFDLIAACANSINALTLVSRDGLMPQLHLDEAQSVARKTVASNAATELHRGSNAAKAWVQSEWALYKGQYENNKSKFARDYHRLVPQQFPGVTATEKTIAQVWLPK